MFLFLFLLCLKKFLFFWLVIYFFLALPLNRYPLFLPPRSMSQTDYVEVLRRCRVEADAREALRARMQSDTSSSSNTGTLSSSASPEGGAVVVVKGKSTAPSRVEVTRDPSALGPGGTAKRMTHIMPLYTKRGDVLSMWLRKDMS